MEEYNLDAFLVTKPENIRYLSGFTGGNDGELLISLKQQCILTDGRYCEQANRECPDWELIKAVTGLDSLAGICDKFNRVGVEGHHLSHQLFMQLEEKLPGQVVPLADMVEKHRQIKDEQEQALLRIAAKIGDRVFSRICSQIKAGMHETELANQICFLLKEEGCSKESFDTIAVAGENASLPHGQPGDRRLNPGDMLTMDFGGYYQGYAGDMTRTIVISEASARLRDIYLRVLEAQLLGVSQVQAGVSGKEIDQKVRDCLKKNKLDSYFVHGTGHGVGLEVHEEPRLSPSSNAILEENMVVTVEPGVYIPGWGGIRIEDTVIVKNGGCEVITHSDKGLIII